MKVLGVLDLLNGRAAHARAGDRERYQPVRTAAGGPIEPGDAMARARAYAERFGIGDLYVADLDATVRAQFDDCPVMRTRAARRSKPSAKVSAMRGVRISGPSEP